MFGKRMILKTGFRCFTVNCRFMHRWSHIINRYFFSVYSSKSSRPPNVSSLPCPPTVISDNDFSPLDVYNALANHDSSKAMGIDGVGPRVLKFCSCELYLSIHHLFQTSLRYIQLRVPCEWCLHRIYNTNLQIRL